MQTNIIIGLRTPLLTQLYIPPPLPTISQIPNKMSQQNTQWAHGPSQQTLLFPPPSGCPTPELPEGQLAIDVALRLLGAIERLVEKLDALADAQFEECQSEASST